MSTGETTIKNIMDGQKFCEKCGFSLIRLSGTHQSLPCDECKRIKYFVRIGENGKGIKVEKGETIHLSLPSISFRPGDGQLTRHGTSWLLKMFIFPPNLRDTKSIDFKKLFDYYDNEFDKILIKTDFFTSRNYQLSEQMSDSDFPDFMEEYKSSEGPEIWAMLGAGHLGMMKKAWEEGDLQALAISMHFVAKCSSVISIYGDVDDCVWRGYKWNLHLYKASGVDLIDPVKVESLEILISKLEKMSNAILNSIAFSNNSISKEMESLDLSEDEIKNVAKFIIEDRKSNHEREIENEKIKQQQGQIDRLESESTKNRQNAIYISVFGIAGAVVSAAIGAAAVILAG